MSLLAKETGGGRGWEPETKAVKHIRVKDLLMKENSRGGPEIRGIPESETLVERGVTRWGEIQNTNMWEIPNNQRMGRTMIRGPERTRIGVECQNEAPTNRGT